MLVSLSNSVFERRTSTGSGLFASLGSGWFKIPGKSPLKEKRILLIQICWRQGKWKGRKPHFRLTCVFSPIGPMPPSSPPLKKQEENWTELTFAKTSGTVSRDKGGSIANNWSALPLYDPRNSLIKNGNRKTVGPFSTHVTSDWSCGTSRSFSGAPNRKFWEKRPKNNNNAWIKLSD